MKPWNPSNMTIKDTGRRVCDNAGCENTATVCFEQGDAVWLACGACVPAVPVFRCDTATHEVDRECSFYDNGICRNDRYCSGKVPDALDKVNVPDGVETVKLKAGEGEA